MYHAYMIHFLNNIQVACNGERSTNHLLEHDDMLIYFQIDPLLLKKNIFPNIDQKPKSLFLLIPKNIW